MADDETFLSCSDLEEEEDVEEEEEEEEEDVLEETVLDELEDETEDCRWSVSSVITKESLLAAQREDLRKVTELLAISEQHARTLLIHYRWDVERFFEYLENKGRDRLFSEAGVTVIENRDVGILPYSQLFTCQVCFDDFFIGATTAMDCGHRYCNMCWTEHFVVRIKAGLSRRMNCMAPKCNSVCDEAVVRKLVTAVDPELADRFDRFLLESYIDDNNKVKWCPSIPHCGNAVRINGDLYCEVECDCGLQFCFSCLSEAHSPCYCAMWELWVQKCKNDSETMNWITINTKPCPKCRKPVEKNGGCNLVCCVCGQAFCWLCAGATGRDHTWTSISGHSCGRYKEDEAKKMEQAQRQLYRYTHYHNRYKAHTDSLKKESELKETVQKKISVSESKQESRIRDFSWVTEGICRLFRSRRILSYSYVFAFYMFGDELFQDEMTAKERELKKNLFEDQQQQLESNVERLSMVLEKDFQEFSDDEVVSTMEKVINLAGVVDTLCKQMYQCIENELLYPLKNVHNIAPYKSKGVERASKFTK